VGGQLFPGCGLRSSCLVTAPSYVRSLRPAYHADVATFTTGSGFLLGRGVIVFHRRLNLASPASWSRSAGRIVPPGLGHAAAIRGRPSFGECALNQAGGAFLPKMRRLPVVRWFASTLVAQQVVQCGGISAEVRWHLPSPQSLRGPAITRSEHQAALCVSDGLQVARLNG